jgi:succinyl-diaminopimelate desuccinylase
VADKLQECGLSTSVVPLAENRANVVGVLKGSGQRPALLYSGHLDTVSLGELPWRSDPLGAEVKNGRVYGRGTADMKAGLAAMVMAGAALARAGLELSGDLVILGTAGEEVNSVGAQVFRDQGGLQGVGAIVIGEPTNLDLVIAHRGALWLEITAIGKAAHGSMPDLGINAIDHMMVFLNRLSDHRFAYQPDPWLRPPTLNLGTIHGGSKTNVVPDKCQATVDLRTLPGQDHQTMLTEFRELASRLAQEIPGFQATVEVIKDTAPVKTPPEAAIVQAALETAQDVWDRPPYIRGAPYLTDASVLAAQPPIPVLIVGPGAEEMAHQMDEYVEIDKVMAAARFYTALALRMLT